MKVGQTVIERKGKLDVAEFELQLFDSRYMLKDQSTTERRRWSGWLKPSCIPISIILVLIILVVLLPLLDHDAGTRGSHKKKIGQLCPNCTDPCVMVLVESIPENLTYDSSAPLFPSIYEGWKDLIENAKTSIDIASFYWTLKPNDVVPGDPSDWQGKDIFEDILKAGTERGIAIRIAQNAATPEQPNRDTEELEEQGAAEVRSVDFERLLGSGVLHTKMWIVDGKHFFVGSANMDWRSLTQVKEVGAIVYNCSCLAKDMAKIFDVYWYLGKPKAKIPPSWPPNLWTSINNNTPIAMEINGTFPAQAYIASSPPPFCPKGRTPDIDAILNVIHKAEKTVDIAVMDYFPTTIYTSHASYWPVIDDALRRAAVDRGVRVRLLVSHWNHTRAAMLYYLRSLAVLNSKDISIWVKLFVVPAFTKEQEQIPFTRVNHNKYMVTDKTVYIGTSNWAGDYFISTGGVGFVIDQLTNDTSSSIRDQLQSLFDRDWNSKYAVPLSRTW